MQTGEQKQKVLIVDDTPENIHMLMETLKHDYSIIAAINGKKGLELASQKSPPDIILLDIMMPEMDGYEVCRQLKAKENTRNIPVIFVTALGDNQNEFKGLNLGAVDYVSKPFHPGLVKARIRNHLDLKAYRDNLEELVRQRTKELEITRDATIIGMGALAEYRDPETGGHIHRTKNYVKILSTYLMKHPDFSDFLDEDTVKMLHKSAPMHDIGKVGVRDNILLKPGKLNKEECEEMKRHTLYGRNAIRNSSRQLGSTSFLHHAEVIAYTHHEKWDGSGYPEGLSGDDIPIQGRIMAISDVYDALISRRVYKAPFTHSKAVEIIAEGRENHFDPRMADAFLEIHEDFRQIATKFADYQEEKDSLAM